jgi:CRISPR-associated exonuclease Cas4
MKAGVKEERALYLWSDRLNLIGKADLVELHPDGTVFPVGSVLTCVQNRQQ